MLRNLGASALSQLRAVKPPRRITTVVTTVRAMTTKAIEEAQQRHAAVLHELFAHPRATHVRWKAVNALLDSLGAHHEFRSHAELISLNGKELVVERPHPSNHEFVESRALESVRTFLTAVGVHPSDACGDGHAAVEAPKGSVLVYISHREARLYELDAEAATPPTLIHAHDPSAHHRHLHLKHGPSHHSTPLNEYVALDKAFLHDITSALSESQQILLAGHGTGKASAVEELLKHWAAHAPEIASKKVAGAAMNVDTHVTDRELVAAGRAWVDRAH